MLYRLGGKARRTWHRQRQRPLCIGCTVGHFNVTAGTLGGFVRPRGGGPLAILSNNHVLANENRGKKDDDILQPGAIDDGDNPADGVATLADFVRFKRLGANLVDAATAPIKEGIDADLTKLKGMGKLNGVGDVFVDEGTAVVRPERGSGRRARCGRFRGQTVMNEHLGNIFRDLGHPRAWIAALVVLATLLSASPVRSEGESVRIGYLPMVSSLTHFVATDQKHYEREGVKVSAGPIATSNLIAQELVADHIDVAIELSIVPLLRLLESRPEAAKLFSLSSITAENGFDAVLVKTSSPVRELCDLGGKRIGVFPGTTARRSLARLFEQRCTTKPPATYAEFEPSLQLPALVKGDVDALHSYEPTVSLALTRDDVRRIHTSVYAAQYTPNPIGVAAANGAFLRKNPAAASKVLRALDSAVVFIRDNPGQARKILADATRVDPKIAARMNLMPMSLVSEVDEGNLQGYLDLLAEMKETGKQHRARDVLMQRP